MIEQWIDITHVYNFAYPVEVSTFGNIRRKRKIDSEFKLLHPSLKSDGYKHIGLITKDKRRTFHSIHKLVALAFIEKPIGRNYVNHKDGNPQNNHVENLEWVTNSENIKHAQRLTNFKRIRTLSAYDIINIAIDIRSIGKSAVFDKYKVSFGTIRSIARRYRDRDIIEHGKQLSIF